MPQDSKQLEHVDNPSRSCAVVCPPGLVALVGSQAWASGRGAKNGHRPPELTVWPCLRQPQPRLAETSNGSYREADHRYFPYRKNLARYDAGVGTPCSGFSVTPS